MEEKEEHSDVQQSDLSLKKGDYEGESIRLDPFFASSAERSILLLLYYESCSDLPPAFIEGQRPPRCPTSKLQAKIAELKCLPRLIRQVFTRGFVVYVRKIN